jgi:hypothetical protein
MVGGGTAREGRPQTYRGRQRRCCRAFSRSECPRNWRVVRECCWTPYQERIHGPRPKQLIPPALPAANRKKWRMPSVAAKREILAFLQLHKQAEDKTAPDHTPNVTSVLATFADLSKWGNRA